MSDNKPKPNRLYLNAVRNCLKYKAFGANDEIFTGQILWEEPPSDFPKKWKDLSEIRSHKKAILDVTLKQGHTH